MTRRAVAVTVTGFTAFLNLYTPQAIQPTLAETFALEAAATGRVVTASLLAVGLVAPFAGAISDRCGRKRLIVGACLLLVLPTLLVATAASLDVLLLWRFLQGLLLPFMFAVTVAYIGEEAPGAEGVRLSGLFGIGSILGGFGGRFICGLVTEWADWRASFLVIALITLAAGIALGLLLPGERRFSPQTGGLPGVAAAWRGHLANPQLLATCAVGCCMLFTNVATYTFVNLHLAAPPYGLSPAALGLVFAVYLVGAGTTALATRLTLRLGRRTTLLLAAGCAAAGLLVSLLTPLGAVIGGLALLSGGLLVVQSLSLGFIAASITHARSSAVGMYVTIYYLGGALGGVVPAPLWRVAGWQGVVGLNLLVLALMALLGRRYWRPATRG